MVKQVLISPSILSADFSEMGKGVKSCGIWGADWIHCDVMDGVYVPNITFGMDMVSALRKHSALPLDVHLMITKPERYIARFVDAGADIVTFHPDASDDVAAAIGLIKSKNRLAGLVLNPDKELELVKQYIDTIDVLVIMGVYAGFGGQSYIPATTKKISCAKRLIKNSGRDIRLEIDGGVTCENIDEILDAGADTIVSGSAIFRASSPGRVLKRMRGENF